MRGEGFDQVLRHQCQLGAALPLPLGGKVERHQPRVGTYRPAERGLLRLDPLLELGHARLVHPHQYPFGTGQLLRRLRKVPAVCPDQSLVSRDEGDASRAREAGEPLAPLIRLRDVLGRMRVTGRYDVGPERMCLEQRSQACKLSGDVGWREVLAERCARPKAAGARQLLPSYG